MMKILYKLLLLVFLATNSFFVIAQPFSDDIAAFKKQDSASFPPKNAILFIGSSSFTRWTDIKDYFPGYTIINRGFGGSSLPDVIRYADDIIFPYQPKQIVIYCGENDLAASDTVTATDVLERFKELFNIIREKLPVIPMVYVSIKPSPSRKHLFEKFRRSNQLIKKFLSGKKNTVFVDVYSKMLNANKSPKADLYVEDNLHMNKKGYQIWQKAIRPHLIVFNVLNQK